MDGLAVAVEVRHILLQAATMVHALCGSSCAIAAASLGSAHCVGDGRGAVEEGQLLQALPHCVSIEGCAVSRLKVSDLAATSLGDAGKWCAG